MLPRIGWITLGIGLPALVVLAAVYPNDVRAAANQDWPPFVLVSGLLALGLVAGDDGLFDAGGALMASTAKGGRSLFVGAALLVAIVTAVLNLDTAVAFLTPVLVVAARRRGTGEAPFLYLAVFLANGASLLLPGSNLTNLIVLGDLHQSGEAFARAMAAPWVAAVLAVTVVVGVAGRRSLRGAGSPVRETVRARARARAGAGLAGVAVAVAAMLGLRPGPAAVVVVCTGAAAVAWSASHGRVRVGELRRTIDVPVLGGLFTLAVVLGAVGRLWSGPERLLAHASSLQAAVVGAGTSVVVNNLPAASLLAARPPGQAHALLIGLDLGPNLAVTGALSAVLWLQVSRTTGADPSPWRYTRLGLVAVPVSMAAALGALALLH